MSQAVATDGAPNAATETLIAVLQEQLQQAQQEKARLLVLLEAEQVAHRELETKLLPAPRPAPANKGRLWALAILLLVVLAGLMVILISPKLLDRWLG